MEHVALEESFDERVCVPNNKGEAKRYTRSGHEKPSSLQPLGEENMEKLLYACCKR